MDDQNGGGESSDLPYGVETVRLGADQDASPRLRGPAFLLQGDGSPLDSAFQAHIRDVAAGPLDVVVLAASFPSGQSLTPECDRIVNLRGVNACETITIPEAAGADLEVLSHRVEAAEIVYFAGGNQCNYVRWEGKAVHTAVEEVVNRGGGVGGGSAGLAIQGDVAYDGCTGSVSSTEALSDPYHSSISFSDSFFNWPELDLLITDSHFEERDRMGRLIAFIARQIETEAGNSYYGLGVNEATAVIIDSSGHGRVFGEQAYLVYGDHPAETVVRDTPLTYSGVDILPLPKTGRYDFFERPMDGAYERSVDSGRLSDDPYVR